MDKDFPTEEELIAGRRADGSKPPLHSREIYDGPRKPFSEEPAVAPVADVVETEQDQAAARMHYEADLQHLSDLDLVADFVRELVVDARQAAREGRDVGVPPAGSSGSASTSRAGETPTSRETPRSEPIDVSTLATPEQKEALERLGLNDSFPAVAKDPYAHAGDLRPPAVKPAGDAEPASAEPEPDRGRQRSSPAKGGHRPEADATKPLTRAQRVAMGISGAKLLVVISAKRAEVAHRLIDASTKLDVRKAFMQDRAVSLVNGLLLHLDEEWSDLGFGAWMPFRWPDQWLSFCGLLTRVLAANGLMHARHADAYRKLLDETPPVEFEGSLQDRIKESKTPLNPAQCKRNQGAATMSELKTRLQSDVWAPKEQWRKQWDNYWQKEHGVAPP